MYEIDYAMSKQNIENTSMDNQTIYDYNNNGKPSKLKHLRKILIILASICVLIAGVFVLINYFFSNDSYSFSAKSADIKEIEYKEKKSDCTVKLSKALNAQSDSEKQAYVINITITNNSDASISDWTMNLTFGNEPALTESWEAIFSMSGNVLKITPDESNKSIGPRSSCVCGFVVYSDADINLDEIVVDFQNSIFSLK